MTGKRFKFNGRNNCIEYDGKSILLDSYGEDIEELLNELNDKCEVLEIENESLEDGATRYAKLYHESLKENEQLKTTIQQLRTDNTKQKKKLNTTMKENEQLKHQLQQQELEYATTCHRLAEENESLKEENKFLRNKVATYKKGNALLKKSMDKEWK